MSPSTSVCKHASTEPFENEQIPSHMPEGYLCNIQFGYWQKGVHNFCFWEDAQKQQEDQTWERLSKFLWSPVEKEPHLQDLGMTGTNKKPRSDSVDFLCIRLSQQSVNEPPESTLRWTCRKRKLPVSSITMPLFFSSSSSTCKKILYLQILVRTVQYFV